MGKRKWLWGALLVCFIAVVIGLFYWEWSEDLRFAKKLQNGINIGNSLDAIGLREYRPEATDLEYETYWNEELITPELLQAIAEVGFSTVRIPVSWGEHMDAEGQITEDWMARVEEVVQEALSQGLYVILNLHHEEWMDLQLEKEAEITQRFQQTWQQVATRFAPYDEKLVFESMNEPRLRGSVYEWTEGTPELRGMVNRLNGVFLETVRQSGGNNAKRYLMISPYATHNKEAALRDLAWTGERVMVSVHIYVPYAFCQQEGGDFVWEDTPEKQQELTDIFGNLEALFLARGVPVVITEFGCRDKGNKEERERWTAFFVEEANQRGMACIWWDNGKDYALISRRHNIWLWPGLVDALVKP